MATAAKATVPMPDLIGDHTPRDVTIGGAHMELSSTFEEQCSYHTDHPHLPLGQGVDRVPPLTFAPGGDNPFRRGNSIMTRTVAALLAAATLIGFAAPATAQTTYYAREHIVRLPKSTAPTTPSAPAETYDATYSNVYGACSNDMQTAPIVSCRDSAGRTVSNSLCPAQSPPKTCLKASCGLVQKYFTNSSGSIGGTSTASTAQAATDYCNGRITAGQKGTCYWNEIKTGPGTVYLVLGSQVPLSSPQASQWASSCS